MHAIQKLLTLSLACCTWSTVRVVALGSQTLPVKRRNERLFSSLLASLLLPASSILHSYLLNPLILQCQQSKKEKN